MAKKRADQLLFERGLAVSRARAQALILAGKVHTSERRIEKAGELLDEAKELVVRGEDHAFVSRGGVKLEGALVHFALEVTGLRCLDVGASTGGFTDCLLQRGAREVVAVDVGYGQLAQKLRDDARVVVMERTNAKAMTPESIGGAVDLTVVDASFIGLAQLLPAIASCTKPGGKLVGLIKPQFEVGREVASKARGVIRDEKARRDAIESVLSDTAGAKFRVLGDVDCVIAGPKGNLEAFVFAERTSDP